MGLFSRDLTAKVAPYLDPGEQLREVLDMHWDDAGRSTPVFVALTDRRMILVEKHHLTRRTVTLDLTQIIGTSTSGGLLPKLTVSATGAQAVVFSAAGPKHVNAIRSAMAAAKK
jgi:hypothetical protein